MVRVIGKENCSSCDMVKKILTNKSIKFTYELFEDLSEVEQKEMIARARAIKQMGMPLVLENDKIINFREVKA